MTLQEEERRELEGIYAKVWHAILAKRPARAEAVVVAELHQDASDPRNNVYASTVVRRVAIGWRTGRVEDFRQMHEAAANFHETAHLGPQADDKAEHMDYGKGEWLGEDRCSGWQVRTFNLDNASGMIEDAIPANSHMRKEPPTSSTGPSVSENHDKNGVEIRFPSKPEAAVIDRLKANGFRWSRHGSCWYHKKDQRNTCTCVSNSR